MHDLIVIGAGPCGYEAAAHAAESGKKVALFEKHELGGVCLNVGCIPTKTLLRSAMVFSECRNAGDYGINNGGEIQLDMKAVQARKKRVVATLKKGVEGMLKRAGVEIVNAEARLIGRGRIAAAGKEYGAENILIATGSIPAVPPVPGIGGDGVLDSTGILDLDEIPGAIVIIGGGIIGLEFACFFAELGTDVTVIEMLPKIAPVLDAEIAERLLRTLKKKGVTFHLSSRVSGIDGNTVSFIDSKNKTQKMTADYVLNSTGRTPVVSGLGLEEVGIDFDKRGIKVDAFGHTNVPGIWAAGDVTGRCLLAHSATREGLVAVNNMFGKADRMRFSAVPSVVYTHPEVAAVGATEAELKEQGCRTNKISTKRTCSSENQQLYLSK